MKKNARVLQRQIHKIKQELMELGDLRPGSLSEQYNVCGNPNCRCKADPPQKHGPYNQLSYTRKRRSRSKFIRPENLDSIKEEIANYARLRELVDSWIDLATEISDHNIAKHAPKGQKRRRQ